MGNGIAQTAAVSGYQVSLMDVAREPHERGQATIAKSVAKLAEKERISEAQKEAVSGAVQAAIDEEALDDNSGSGGDR